MDANARHRADVRRASWQGGVARTFEELEEKGLEFWRNAPPGARLTAMWQLIVDASAMEGTHGAPPGFQGSIVGIGRFEG